MHFKRLKRAIMQNLDFYQGHPGVSLKMRRKTIEAYIIKWTTSGEPPVGLKIQQDSKWGHSWTIHYITNWLPPSLYIAIFLNDLMAYSKWCNQKNIGGELTLFGNVEVYGVDKVIVRLVPGLVTGPEDRTQHGENVWVLGSDVTHYSSGNEFPEINCNMQCY